jgi:hypothetical protein
MLAWHGLGSLLQLLLLTQQPIHFEALSTDGCLMDNVSCLTNAGWWTTASPVMLCASQQHSAMCCPTFKAWIQPQPSLQAI